LRHSEPITDAERAVLRRVPGFGTMTDDELVSVAGLCAREGFAAGAALMRQGMVADDCFILLDGTAEVSVMVDLGPVVVASLSAGALVGEIALLCDTPRTATVTAAEPVRALVISRARLPQLVSAVPAFAMVLMRALAGRLEQNVEAIAYFKVAAQSLQQGSFDLAGIEAITQRDDEVGVFARSFATMARAVQEREAQLRAQVQELRIEIDQARKARQVAEITETPEFNSLLERAQAMRARRTQRS
jgi:CRP-like cAMP-binding protein